jgi:hypothetical protein
VTGQRRRACFFVDHSVFAIMNFLADVTPLAAIAR